MTAKLEDRVSSHSVSRVVYGSIIGLALIVALEKHPPAAGVVTGTLVATAVAVGLAELYSEVLAGQRAGDVAGDVVGTMFGIAFPSVFFVLASAGAIELDTAFEVAKWSGLGLIGFYGFYGARLEGKAHSAAALRALVVMAIAAALIAFKSLLH